MISQRLFVQSSYKLNLPPYLIVSASNLKLCEFIGQGNLNILATMSPIPIVILHTGEFGIVYKGHIVKDQGTKQVVAETVAVKTLKGMLPYQYHAITK